jgi:hypothetical protein
MRFAVLAAFGSTGHQLAVQALDRGTVRIEPRNRAARHHSASYNAKIGETS